MQVRKGAERSMEATYSIRTERRPRYLATENLSSNWVILISAKVHWIRISGGVAGY
jgi:hypothetical protein